MSKRNRTKPGESLATGVELRYRLRTEANRAPDALRHTAPPRIARLLALAIRCEELLARGAVRDQTALARLGHVSPSRMTQILSLRLLAPDIQEEILLLPRSTRITEKQLRSVCGLPDWREQRRRWYILQDEAPIDCRMIPPAVSVAQKFETKYLRLRQPPELGTDIDGWRVCWLGGWDKGKVFFVVMVQRIVADGR